MAPCNRIELSHRLKQMLSEGHKFRQSLVGTHEHMHARKHTISGSRLTPLTHADVNPQRGLRHTDRNTHGTGIYRTEFRIERIDKAPLSIDWPKDVPSCSHAHVLAELFASARTERFPVLIAALASLVKFRITM